MIAIKKSSLLISIILFILIVTTLPLPALQIEGAYEYAAANTFEPKMQTTGCIIYVDDDNTIGPWDGTIDHPYQYIQDGISNAQSHDHIYVFNGSYYDHLHINKPLYIEGESNKHTIIDGGFISHVISISAQNVTLTQFTIQNSGITISDAAIIINNPHCTITQNNIHNNYHGLILNSPNNTIFFNNFLENHNHAFSSYTNNITLNFWDDYTGNDQDENGIGDTGHPISGCNNTDPSPLIHRYGAVQNQDNKEIFFNIQSAIESANTLDHHTIILEPDTYYEHLIILKPITLQGTSPDTCIIDGKDIDVVVTITANTSILADLTIQHSGFNQSDAGILILGHSTHISNTLITQNYLGMKLSDAQNTQINHNHVIENHWIGIMINHNSHYNTIKYNVFQSNGYAGIGINISSDNTIYHNDFIANSHNAYDDAHNTWDNDFPSGGNYWDDYIGIDKNNDGLGDTPYLIQGGINEDRYPLMYPLESYDATPPAVMIIQPTIGFYIRNHRLLSRLFSKLNNQQIIVIGKINIQAIADDDESGITQINFYLNNEPNPQKIDFEPPYQWLWKRGTFPPDIHQIKVVAYNGAGVYNSHIISVKRFL